MANTHLQLEFLTLDVFTDTRYQGNPLAIVHVPPTQTLSQAQKQTIAGEFNLSETVFLHEPPDNSDTFAIDIFTTQEELPFAGHPTVGSGWHILSQIRPHAEQIVLKTKAGLIPVRRTAAAPNSDVRLQVPVEFKTHSPYAHPTLKSHQLALTGSDYHNGLENPEPVASVVKGMTFLLLQVTSEEALAKLRPFSERQSVPGLGEWGGFVGIYSFFISKEEDQGRTTTLRTRMFDGSLEDPATGSAASTLAGWLAQQKGRGTWTFRIVQGVEMGRRSEISVVVEVDSTIEKIYLEGGAVQVTQGRITV